jgi:hypothetical protein
LTPLKRVRRKGGCRRDSRPIPAPRIETRLGVARYMSRKSIVLSMLNVQAPAPAKLT